MRRGGLEDRKRFKFAEQLRAAALSISNNIAEGCGSVSEREFAHFLNIARRSTFENANMVIMFQKRRLIADGSKESLISELAELSCMITGFKRSLGS